MIHSSPVKLFDMREGYGSIVNILGISDPSVHFIERRWVMYVGGFNTRFKNNIYSLHLPRGYPLSCNEWKFDTDPGNPRIAQALITQPKIKEWDGYGLHSPCYVKGLVDGTPYERIYYAGRSSGKITDNSKPYRIGYLEKADHEWKHQSQPLAIEGAANSLNVLEPKVEYMDGKWRMRYVTTPVESGKIALPNYRIMYTESEDGVNNWSEPSELFSNQEGYYDSIVIKTKNGYGMIVTRNSNLYSRDPYPEQGIWWLTANFLSKNRNDWSKTPQKLLEPAKDPDGWYVNGMCGPSAQYGNTSEDEDTLYIFFVSATKKTPWLKTSLMRLLRGNRPLVPAPYYLAIGRIEVSSADLM